MSPDDHNEQFKTLHDFNATNATPILRLGSGEYLLFQYYSLVEALYESPIYWMTADKDYEAAAFKHKGDFAEAISHERLKHVFGDKNVYPNVKIIGPRGITRGEIDVLVLYGDIAVIVQAKTRRLSIQSRKGNDLQLQTDFKKAVQESYDQAYDCSQALLDPQFKLIDANNQPIEHTESIKNIYPMCIVADHYPALAYQARHFLNVKEAEHILPPLVSDVFALDAMAEMLDTPLRFLSYLKLRARFGEKIMAMHELTLLSDHIKRNLWVDGKYDIMMLSDDIAADLDAAMIVRREGLPGKKTPDGILTRFRESTIGRLIDKLEEKPDPIMVDLGLFLLELNEDTTSTLSRAIDTIISETTKDGRNHDVTLGFGSAESGITIYCIPKWSPVALERLEIHCTIRKYSQKAASWWGLIFSPDGFVRIGLKIENPWEYNERIEKAAAEFGVKPLTKDQFHAQLKANTKIGQNAPCPCGSIKKYKKCCLNR